mmetsp:Transcript_39924/g.71812  ORF Transcript_39924/g.71812 Transcript_39924/m.71812 type:complete len:121 (+) Transcript_39924:792-1154(+)
MIALFMPSPTHLAKQRAAITTARRWPLAREEVEEVVEEVADQRRRQGLRGVAADAAAAVAAVGVEALVVGEGALAGVLQNLVAEGSVEHELLVSFGWVVSLIWTGEPSLDRLFDWQVCKL